MKQWISDLDWAKPIYFEKPDQFEYDEENHVLIQRKDIEEIELQEHDDLNQKTAWTCKERKIPDNFYEMISNEIDTILDNELMSGQLDIMDGMSDIYIALENLGGVV